MKRGEMEVESSELLVGCARSPLCAHTWRMTVHLETESEVALVIIQTRCPACRAPRTVRVPR